MNEGIEEYLERGIHGALEIKSGERAYFLTALRERIELALKKGQLMKNQVYPEMSKQIKRVKNGHLYLNGEVDYGYLSRYIKLANEASVPFTIVQNLQAETDIGLVLTGSEGSEEKDIFIEG